MKNANLKQRVKFKQRQSTKCSVSYSYLQIFSSFAFYD